MLQALCLERAVLPMTLWLDPLICIISQGVGNIVPTRRFQTHQNDTTQRVLHQKKSSHHESQEISRTCSELLDIQWWAGWLRFESASWPESQALKEQPAPKDVGTSGRLTILKSCLSFWETLKRSFDEGTAISCCIHLLQVWCARLPLLFLSTFLCAKGADTSEASGNNLHDISSVWPCKHK